MSKTKAITMFSIIKTVKIQKVTKKIRGHQLLKTKQYMLHVTYQLFTIKMWNSVMHAAAKSLKFIKYQSGGVKSLPICCEFVVIAPPKRNKPN